LNACVKISFHLFPNLKQKIPMKKLFIPLLFSMFVVAACQEKTLAPVADPAAEKAIILNNLDMMYSAYTGRDANTFMAFWADSSLFCGTAPDEFWNKEDYTSIMQESMADTSITLPAFTFGKREVILDKDANSAVVVERLFIEGSLDRMPMRNVTFHQKTDTAWVCTFSSMSFTPRNEDLSKIMAALKE
jgi:hypothetical protein